MLAEYMKQGAHLLGSQQQPVPSWEMRETVKKLCGCCKIKSHTVL